MKNVRSALMIFSGLVMAGAVLLLLWANWPPSHTHQTTTLHLIAPSDWDVERAEQIKTHSFSLGLIYPETIKLGQTAHYDMAVDGLPATIMVGGVEYRLRIRAQLIMPGFINRQAGMETQTIQDQNTARFNWDVDALETRSSNGILQIYIDYAAPDQTVYPQLTSVKELGLTVSGLAGLSTGLATSLAVALVLLAGLAGGLGLTRPRPD